MKMSEHDDSSDTSSSEDQDLEGSDLKNRKPPRRNSLSCSTENLSTAGGYIAKIEKDLNKILKKLKIITLYQQKLKEQKDSMQV